MGLAHTQLRLLAAPDLAATQSVGESNKCLISCFSASPLLCVFASEHVCVTFLLHRSSGAIDMMHVGMHVRRTPAASAALAAPGLSPAATLNFFFECTGQTPLHAT